MRRIAFSSLAIIATSLAAQADPVAPEAVTYADGAVEASLSGAPGDPDAGREVMITRGLGNCIACHHVTSLLEAPFHGEVGPPLDGAADRWTPAELRGIVANAKMTFEGSMMPSFYKRAGYIRPGDAYTGKASEVALSTLLSAQQIEDVVAYLATLKE